MYILYHTTLPFVLKYYIGFSLIRSGLASFCEITWGLLFHPTGKQPVWNIRMGCRSQLRSHDCKTHTGCHRPVLGHLPSQRRDVSTGHVPWRNLRLRALPAPVQVVPLLAAFRVVFCCFLSLLCWWYSHFMQFSVSFIWLDLTQLYNIYIKVVLIFELLIFHPYFRAFYFSPAKSWIWCETITKRFLWSFR